MSNIEFIGYSLIVLLVEYLFIKKLYRVNNIGIYFIFYIFLIFQVMVYGSIFELNPLLGFSIKEINRFSQYVSLIFLYVTWCIFIIKPFEALLFKLSFELKETKNIEVSYSDIKSNANWSSCVIAYVLTLVTIFASKGENKMYDYIDGVLSIVGGIILLFISFKKLKNNKDIFKSAKIGIILGVILILFGVTKVFL